MVQREEVLARGQSKARQRQEKVVWSFVCNVCVCV